LQAASFASQRPGISSGQRIHFGFGGMHGQVVVSGSTTSSQRGKCFGGKCFGRAPILRFSGL